LHRLFEQHKSAQNAHGRELVGGGD
jgi:hypothetical protein